MPTKKRRVGFIPRNNVLEIIEQLSFESNLSTSKIINLLVEEALYKRGILNKKKLINDSFNKKISVDNQVQDHVISTNNKKELIRDFNKKLLINKNCDHKDVNYDPIDSEIYEKFIMFLKFQEKMKKTNF